MSESAARVTSSVVHGASTATYAGAAAGFIVVGILVTVLTGGLSMVAAAGVVATGISAGSIVDKYSGLDASEKIVRGVEHVFLDEPKHSAANASDDTRTDQHDGRVVSGSDSVFVANCPASRRRDAVECSGAGQIASGSEHIFYGGGDSRARMEVEQALPGAMRALSIVASVISMAERPTSLWRAANWVLDARSASNQVAIELGHEVTPSPMLDSVDALRGPATTIEALIGTAGDLVGAVRK